MNTSFRTAFWALCLGLTVPMVLFVGVELTSGGNAARKARLSAYDHRGSLRGYWEKSDPKRATRPLLRDAEIRQSSSLVASNAQSPAPPRITPRTPAQTS